MGLSHQEYYTIKHKLFDMFGPALAPTIIELLEEYSVNSASPYVDCAGRLLYYWRGKI